MVENVQRGIEYLNKHFWGWKKYVDVETLDMTSAKDCILGQVFGDYDVAIFTVGLLDYSDRVWYGFTAHTAQEQNELTTLWKEALA